MWLRAVAAWLALIAAETLHGIARTLFLQPAVGDQRARQIAVFSGCVVIFAVAAATIRWIAPRGGKALLVVGALWVLLTICFEIGLGRALGYSWDRLIEDYDPRRGGLLGLGMFFLLWAPYLAARWRLPQALR